MRIGFSVQSPVGALGNRSPVLHPQTAPWHPTFSASHILGPSVRTHLSWTHAAPNCLSTKELASPELGAKWLLPSRRHSTVQRQRGGRLPTSARSTWHLSLARLKHMTPKQPLVGGLGPHGTWLSSGHTVPGVSFVQRKGRSLSKQDGEYRMGASRQLAPV